ncbi:MAG: carbohydrate binding domain-containing protein, partial [Victivallaceae bacterium]|nr:carbohydrate binding domain-containing protein [Victivallaceae bacterium]
MQTLNCKSCGRIFNKTYWLLGIAVYITNSWLYADTSANLVPNGDFEANAGQAVCFWDHGYTWSGNYKTFKDTDIKYSGKQSVKIENTGQVGRSAWVLRNSVPVKEKTGYCLSLYVKSLNASNIFVQLTCYRSKEKNINLQYRFLPGTYEWKKYSFNFEAPENTEKIRIYLFSTGSGSVWFDNLTFEEQPLTPEEKEKVITRLGIDYYYSPRNQTPDPALPAAVTTGNKSGWLLYHRLNPRDTYPDSVPQTGEILSDDLKNFSTP